MNVSQRTGASGPATGAQDMEPADTQGASVGPQNGRALTNLSASIQSRSFKGHLYGLLGRGSISEVKRPIVAHFAGQLPAGDRQPNEHVAKDLVALGQTPQFPDLPNEVTEFILSLLPMKSALQLMRVSHGWNQAGQRLKTLLVHAFRAKQCFVAGDLKGGLVHDIELKADTVFREPVTRYRGETLISASTAILMRKIPLNSDVIDKTVDQIDTLPPALRIAPLVLLGRVYCDSRCTDEICLKISIALSKAVESCKPEHAARYPNACEELERGIQFRTSLDKINCEPTKENIESAVSILKTIPPSTSIKAADLLCAVISNATPNKRRVFDNLFYVYEASKAISAHFADHLHQQLFANHWNDDGSYKRMKWIGSYKRY